MIPDRIPSGDRLLLQVIDSAFDEARQKSGEHLICRPGCTECCMGPFAITMLDGWRLREGLKRLPIPRAIAVRERARNAAKFLGSDLPEDPEEEERYATDHAALPCPALDPVTGHCDLYAYRPITCRTFGPPVRIGGDPLPPCRLCYTAASDAVVDACRIEIDPDGIEDWVLSAMETAGTLRRRTTVAFALLGE